MLKANVRFSKPSHAFRYMPLFLFFSLQPAGPDSNLSITVAKSAPRRGRYQKPYTQTRGDFVTETFARRRVVHGENAHGLFSHGGDSCERDFLFLLVAASAEGCSFVALWRAFFLLLSSDYFSWSGVLGGVGSLEIQCERCAVFEWVLVLSGRVVALVKKKLRRESTWFYRQTEKSYFIAVQWSLWNVIAPSTIDDFILHKKNSLAGKYR